MFHFFFHLEYINGDPLINQMHQLISSLYSCKPFLYGSSMSDLDCDYIEQIMLLLIAGSHCFFYDYDENFGLNCIYFGPYHYVVTYYFH